MRTVKAVMHTLTDTQAILEEMRIALREIDPNYLAEEMAYQQAMEKIRELLPPEMMLDYMKLVMLRENAIANDLLFLLWNGLHLNLDCFHQPTCKLLLRMDYEDIHQEDIMQSMPVSKEYWARADAFYRGLTLEQHKLFEPITSYYAYIQTTVYKLAHYFGFVLGDELLRRVIPGYQPDRALSISYGMELRNYLDVDTEKLAA